MITNGTLKEANKLFQNREYSKALEIYERLYSINPALDFYEFNIFMCKKKLGFPVSYLNKVSSNQDREVVLGKSVVKHFSKQSGTDIVFIQANIFYLTINEQLDKICFYIASLNNAINKIYFISDYLTALPENIDCEKYPHYSKYVNDFILLPMESLNNKFIDDLKPKVISYVYDEKGLPDSLVSKHDILREIAKVSGNLWRVHDDIQHHGSFYLKSVSDYNNCKDSNEIFKSKLLTMIKYTENRPVYLFGTGPSLKYSYCIDDIEQSTVIACNSVVNNKTMLEYLKPDIICATDPIFHAGWGKYADEFRKNLIVAMGEYEFTLVVPSRDLHIYHNFIPKNYLCRIASYEFDPEIQGLNNNLIESQKVAPRPNVLTNIMLPIASTLTKDIRIGGCDGKKDPSSYFWEHDKASQFNNKMEDIQKEFKGFFDISYDKYYADHCSVLKNQIDFLISNNYKVSSVTPSYIPVLADLNQQTESMKLSAKIFVDVAVVMPSRNMESSIIKSIKSVIVSAEYANASYRVIVINENSTDKTKEVVQDNFGKEIQNGSILMLDTTGLGVSCARNMGLTLSNSKYVTFLDSDDFISENSLKERISALYNSDPGVIASFSKTKLVDVENNKTISVANDFKSSSFKYTYERIHGPAHISSILYKTGEIIGLKFPEGVKFGEDWLFLSRALRAGGEMKFVSDSHTIYSVHSGSVTKLNPQEHIKGLFGILNKVYFTDDGYEDSEGKYYYGLSNLNNVKHIPSYYHKIAELTMRLLACLFVSNQVSQAYRTLLILFKDYEISWSAIDQLIEGNIEKMKEAFIRDVIRFSGEREVDVDKVATFINLSKVWQQLPILKKISLKVDFHD
jgi:glycosyltransferase involved in cell wall biosynthesis